MNANPIVSIETFASRVAERHSPEGVFFTHLMIGEWPAQMVSETLSKTLGHTVRVTDADNEDLPRVNVTRFSRIAISDDTGTVGLHLGDLQSLELVHGVPHIYTGNNYVRLRIEEDTLTLDLVPENDVNRPWVRSEALVSDWFYNSVRRRAFKYQVNTKDQTALDVLHYFAVLWDRETKNLDDPAPPFVNMLAASLGKSKLRKLCGYWPEFKKFSERLSHRLNGFKGLTLTDLKSLKAPTKVKNVPFYLIPVGSLLLSEERDAESVPMLKTGKKTVTSFLTNSAFEVSEDTVWTYILSY